MSAGRTFPYELLFSVELRHAYFASPSRLRIRVEPDAATRAWLSRTGCVTRVVGNVLQVWFETERNGPYRHTTAQGAAAFLRFGVYAQDPQFTRFTDGLPVTSRAPLTYWTFATGTDGEMAPIPGLSWIWSEGPRPDLVIVALMAGALTARVARPAKPAVAATATLPARPAEPAVEAVPGPALRISLRSRESVWKYYLLEDCLEPSIADLEGDIAFDSLTGVTLPDGRQVTAFRARTPIPLQERFTPRFKLNAAARPGEAPIGRLLPVPSAANLARDPDPSVGPLVSEIFVPA